jgi:putative transcriptional regulator
VAVEVRLDIVMVQKKISLKELAGKIGMSTTNLSLIKNGKVRGIRFNTLNAICEALDCGPGDLLAYVPDASNDDVLLNTGE